MAATELETKAASLALSDDSAAPQPFGKGMLKYFAFADGWRNLNHGSFGTYPVPVRTAQRRFQDIAEEQPDKFQRYDQVKYLNAARAEAAALVNAPLSTLVMVPNVTTGVNTMLRNIEYAQGDVIVYFSTTYGACQKIVLSTVEVTAATSHRIQLSYPMTDDEILDLFHDTIATLRSQGKNPRVAMLDTIISLPGVRMPFERLIAACKELGLFSVVDAAHGIGQLSFDLTSLDPDFLTSNCHKWLLVPKGCAIMYVPHRNQKLMRTSFPTSHYFVPTSVDGGEAQVSNPLASMSGDDTPFTKLFEYVGTLDLSPYLVVPAALEFRKTVCGGEEKVMKYCSDLASTGGALVAKKLGTEILDNEQGSMTKGCAMVNVRLPLIAPEAFGSSNARSPQVNGNNEGSTVQLDERGPNSVIGFVERLLVDEFNMFIAVLFYGGCWWARLSGQIYLDLDDFEAGADALAKACERVKAGEHLSKA